MEISVEKTKVMRILKLPSQVQIMIHQKQLEKVKYLEYLGSMIMMQDVHVKLNPGLLWQ